MHALPERTEMAGPCPSTLHKSMEGPLDLQNCEEGHNLIMYLSRKSVTLVITIYDYKMDKFQK